MLYGMYGGVFVPSSGPRLFLTNTWQHILYPRPRSSLCAALAPINNAATANYFAVAAVSHNTQQLDAPYEYIRYQVSVACLFHGLIRTTTVTTIFSAFVSRAYRVRA